jgi:hypothetical protein
LGLLDMLAVHMTAAYILDLDSLEQLVADKKMERLVMHCSCHYQQMGLYSGVDKLQMVQYFEQGHFRL